MPVNPDYMREVLLTFITVGPGLALAAYLVGLFYDRREERQRQEPQQRARALKQNKRRLRIHRGNS